MSTGEPSVPVVDTPSASMAVPGTGSALPEPPPSPALGEPDPAEDLPLPMMLEALLMVADEPVTELLLAELCGHPVAAVSERLSQLAEEYEAQGRGFELRQAAGGWRLYTRAECAALVERFVLRGQHARMTQAA